MVEIRDRTLSPAKRQRSPGEMIRMVRSARLGQSASDPSLLRLPRHPPTAPPKLRHHHQPACPADRREPAAPNFPPAGVSAAFLINFLAEHGPRADAPPEQRTTRFQAVALKRRQKEAGREGAYSEALVGETDFTTGGALAGTTRVHVAHAWDGSFPDLVDCVAADAGSDFDRTYGIDVFTTDLHAASDDPVTAVRNLVAGVDEVLLVLDAAALALSRLWILFEVILATVAGKLRVRCSAPEGFRASEEAVLAWERNIDAVDWVLAEATRRSDDKRLRAFAEKEWEARGKGIERMLAQLKALLRREVYGQLLVSAVERGDRKAAEAVLERGANPEQQDAFGNTVEELASFGGHKEIEELLFVRRMGPSLQLHPRFHITSSDITAAEIAAASELAFLTEPAEVDQECDTGHIPDVLGSEDEEAALNMLVRAR